jgi:DNA-binding NarL/FixJ family response regulator
MVPEIVPSEESIPATIIVIEKRAMLRECLTRCFEAALGTAVISFASVEDWVEVKDQKPACIIVLSIGDAARKESLQRDLGLLRRVASYLPITLLADDEEPSEVAAALECGARGYIPTTVTLAIAIEAIRLVRAGGVYVPARHLMAASRQSEYASADKHLGDITLTGREAAVLDALCRGKANKVIASELNVRESTVKVHVRNLMRKLKAKNRTEVAYLAQELIQKGKLANTSYH